jgi:hypothetical protein
MGISGQDNLSCRWDICHWILSSLCWSRSGQLSLAPMHLPPMSRGTDWSNNNNAWSLDLIQVLLDTSMYMTNHHCNQIVLLKSLVWHFHNCLSMSSSFWMERSGTLWSVLHVNAKGMQQDNLYNSLLPEAHYNLFWTMVKTLAAEGAKKVHDLQTKIHG